MSSDSLEESEYCRDIQFLCVTCHLPPSSLFSSLSFSSLSPLFSSILQVLSLAHDQAWSVLSHGRTQKGTALPDQLHQKGGYGLLEGIYMCVVTCLLRMTHVA